jgi:subtilisin-like proprotein convertase family protein
MKFMKPLLLTLAATAISLTNVSGQCTTTNATSCVCKTAGSTNCDLLPDIIVGRPPLLASGTNGVIEYSQTGNGAENGRLRVSVSTPNIGHGPLEIRTTNTYICGTDTITGTAPATCPNTGLPPKQLIKQRIYQKNGNAMTFYDRNAGSMTYHPSHGHMHVDDWGIYTLRSQSTDPNPLNWPIVGTGAKLAFCLMDYGSCSTYNGHCVDSLGNTLTNGNFPNYGLGGGGYNCSSVVQGISSGYTDIYYQYLDGMYITIPPGTCNGNYFIVVQLDPYNYFLEENENNNVIVVPYTLTKQAGTIPVITASGSTNICPGSSVTLTSSPAPSYLWSTGATTQSIIVSQAGSYTVTTDVGSSCSGTSQPMQVTMQNMTTTVNPSANPVCPGQSTTLNTVVNTPPTATVQSSFTNNTVYNIPDNNAAGVLSPISVSGISPATLSAGVVVSVQVNITHTYTGDLILSLISPSGNTVILSNRRGGSGNHFTNTIFRMSATIPIASGSPPFAGSYIPDGNLNSFTGNANGTWQLKAADVANTDIGTINSWTLTLNNVVSVQLAYSWTSNPPGFNSTSSAPTVTPSVPTTYMVTVNNLTTGCSGSGSSAITLDPASVSVSPGVAVCTGESTTLNASGGVSYNWSPSSGLNNTSGSSVTASPTTTTTYTVTATNATGCTAQGSVTVTVNNLPVVTVSPDVSVCAGESTTLNASGGVSYNWSPSSGLNNTSGSSVTASPTTTTNYTVIATDASGCTGQSSVTVTVNSLPAVSVDPMASVCNNVSPIALTAGVPSGGTWSGAGVINGASFDPAVAGPGVHTLSYTYTDSNGCTSSAAGDITVLDCSCPPPNTPGTMSGTTKLCPGVNATYSVPNVASVTNYNWTVPAGVNIVSGQGTNSITVMATPNFVSGSVCVYAQNNCGTSAARCKSVSKNTAKTPGTISGGLFGHCASVATLSVAAVSGAVSYTWTVPAGVNILSGQGTNSVTIETPAGFVSGQVCVTSYNGCLNSNARCATIYGAPAKPVIQGDNFSCAGQTKTYFVNPSYGATYYNWGAPSGSSIVSGQSTTSAEVLFGSVSGKVRLTASNACGNRGTATLNVNITCRESDAVISSIEFNIIPNPASGKTFIHIQGLNDSDAELIVTDILGKEINRIAVDLSDSDRLELSLEGWNPGIYLLQLRSGTDIKSKRLVIN